MVPKHMLRFVNPQDLKRFPIDSWMAASFLEAGRLAVGELAEMSWNHKDEGGSRKAILEM